MKTNDMDPRGGGIGFIKGCLGCKALVMGTARAGHNDNCRLRVMEKIGKHASGEGRAKAARAREDEHLSRKLEELVTKKAMRRHSRWGRRYKKGDHTVRRRSSLQQRVGKGLQKQRETKMETVKLTAKLRWKT